MFLTLRSVKNDPSATDKFLSLIYIMRITAVFFLPFCRLGRQGLLVFFLCFHWTVLLFLCLYYITKIWKKQLAICKNFQFRFCIRGRNLRYLTFSLLTYAKIYDIMILLWCCGRLSQDPQTKNAKNGVYRRKYKPDKAPYAHSSTALFSLIKSKDFRPERSFLRSVLSNFCEN